MFPDNKPKLSFFSRASSHARAFTKRRVSYQPDQRDLALRLESIRSAISAPTVMPPYVGDTIVRLICEHRLNRCLEIGMATGSSASYMLRGVELLGSGRVVSIDRAQSTAYGSVGLKTVSQCVNASSHSLIEADSIEALRTLHANGERFGFVFMDGWKTFDHLAAELYTVARLLQPGGIIMFDDYHMPSVRRAVRMLQGHYQMTPLALMPDRARPYLLALGLYAWLRQPTNVNGFIATLQGNACALQLSKPIEELEVTRDWNFYAPF